MLISSDNYIKVTEIKRGSMLRTEHFSLVQNLSKPFNDQLKLKTVIGSGAPETILTNASSSLPLAQ